MGYTIYDNGNIECFQGDTIKLPLTGIDTSHDYAVYLQIRDENRNPIGTQVQTATGGLPDVLITISDETTDLLTVPQDEDTKTYYYGVKLVYNGEENTLFLGEGATFDTMYEIIVHPKKADGE